MKTIKKIISIFVLVAFILTACKNENKKNVTKKEDIKKEVSSVNTQKLNLNISGMTCEIGCAKTIQSKLSKKEGVSSAKVIFKDSLAVIKYDVTKTNKKDLIAFVEGIAGGKTYTAKETNRIAKSCKAGCKKSCCANKDKKSCKGKDKKNCKKGAKCNHKTKEECKKAGCTKKNKATCKSGCTKPCCVNKDKKA